MRVPCLFVILDRIYRIYCRRVVGFLLGVVRQAASTEADHLSALRLSAETAT